MTRARSLIAAAVIAAASVAAVLWQRGTPQVSRGDGPIIIISIDTLRADRLPAYGYAGTRTPNIDRLAADGVLFENAYSHSPQTLPAHASILSGTLPFEHGVRDNVGFTVKPGERFLQHALVDQGYATAGFVSAYVLRQQTGINQGFQTYDDVLPAASPDAPLGQVQRAGSDTVAAAVRWIDGQPSPKFFLFVHIYEPHRPYDPPARFAASNPYDGEVSFSDEIVGTLIEHLRKKDLYDRASIVLLSDHGEGLGDHGEEEHGIFLYRETIRVPLIIKAPASRGAGTRVAAAVQHLDIAPTLIQMGGGAPAAALKGRSLLPVIEGTGALAEASIYSESLSPRYHFGWSELYALSDDRYRLIRAPRDELYDITQDPGERRSIAGDRTQAHAAMRRALDTMIANEPVDAPSAVSDEDRGRLAALGYVGTQSAGPVAAGALPDPKDKIAVLRQYKRATELAGQGRLQDATDAYRSLLGDEPEMADVWLQLAGVYEQRGMFAEAVAAYRQIITRRPKDPAALTGAAGGLLRLGRLGEARAHAELAVDVAPAIAHELLTRVAIESGDAAAARRHATLAQQADPTLPMRAFAEGMLAHRAGQFSAAIPHFLEARRAMASRTVQMPDVNYYLGDTLARLERHAEAEQYFAAELAVFPAHLRARAGLAILYRVTGRISESDAAVGELIRRSPTPEGFALAAQLWTMFGEPDRASAVRTRARGLTR